MTRNIDYNLNQQLCTLQSDETQRTIPHVHNVQHSVKAKFQKYLQYTIYTLHSTQFKMCKVYNVQNVY